MIAKASIYAFILTWCLTLAYTLVGDANVALDWCIASLCIGAIMFYLNRNED